MLSGVYTGGYELQWAVYLDIVYRGHTHTATMPGVMIAAHRLVRQNFQMTLVTLGGTIALLNVSLAVAVCDVQRQLVVVCLTIQAKLTQCNGRMF